MFEIKKVNNIRYIEEGKGQPILFLYGLFGNLKNFYNQVEFFKNKYKVIVPDLPLLEQNIFSTNLKSITEIVSDFISLKKLDNIHLVGNSLGGHVALYLCLKNQNLFKSLILTGSSGLFESGMGDSYPRKGDYNYIKQKVEYTFYNPDVANKELVDEVFAIVNDRMKILKIIHLARSAIKSNLSKDLENINLPSMIIWGKNDNITPVDVAFEFNRLLKNSQVKLIDLCGHAPMMERPEEFNKILEEFLLSLT